jgi:integrase
MAWAEKRGPWYRVRYRDADGVVRTTPDKYRTKTEALEAAEDLDTDHRRGTFIDPHDARTSVADWAAQWRKTHLVAASTQAKYDHYLDNHIIPAFGQLSLDQIRRSAVKEWAIDLRARYSPATVRGIVTLMSLLLTAAVEERMIAINPIQGLRMAEPRTRHHPHTAMRQVAKRPVPTGEQVLAIADRIKILGGRSAQAMVITAAFTGMRWGEITGLAKTNCHLERLCLLDRSRDRVTARSRGADVAGPAQNRRRRPPYRSAALPRHVPPRGDERS